MPNSQGGTDAMERLKLGVIGAGMAFERLHYPAYQELNKEYQIAAICDVDRAKAMETAQKVGLGESDIYTDFREMVRRDDLQVFDIMVPIGKNFTIAEETAALVSGTKKGIILEKPLGPTPEQAKAAAEIPRKYQVMMMIAENYRYNEETNLIRDLVREGQLGEVDYFICNRAFSLPEDMKQDTYMAREWRQHPDFPGGVFYDGAVHDMAALRHIFGAIDEVAAYGQKKAVSLGQYTVVNAIFRFTSGLTGSYNFYSGGKELQAPLIGLRIMGRNGELYHEDRDSGVINLAFTQRTTKQVAYRPRRGYYNELLNFYKAYLGQETLAVSPEMEYGDARTIFAILESIEHETPVKVDWDDEYSFYANRMETAPGEYQKM
jgi:predicted dehydrogenase